MNAETLGADQSDDPALFKALTQTPRIAWPTVLVLIAAFALFGLSTFAYLEGTLPLYWAILINTIAAYLSFTPAHDASHHAVSTIHKLNDWVGRVATMLQSPIPFFRSFRYIHMQHHRFTNDQTKDPDMYVGAGSHWLLPLKWATLDLGYLFYYMKPSVFLTRPQGERRELYLALVFGAVVFTAVTYAGWLSHYLLLFFLPTRLNAIILAIVFDYLPHYPHQAKATERFQCTSNRVGLEWLMTPVLLSQNYHLVHHLYPRVPFFRYLKIWQAKKQYHESQNPATVDTFSLGHRLKT